MQRRSNSNGRLAAACLVTMLVQGALLAQGADRLPRTREAWTFREAQEAFSRAPRDPYCQFLLVQTGRAEGQLDQALQSLRERGRWRPDRSRFEDLDLFSLTSGALAAQESLQLDTLLAEDDATVKTFDGDVALATLAGPGVKSHPWREMLAGRAPAVSQLAQCAPADFYFVESRSLNDLLELLDSGDVWQQNLAIQAGFSANSVPVAERVRKQLAVEVNDLLKPAYDLIVDRVAVVGSDLYFKVGNDVTLLFSVQQPALFQAQMDGSLKAAIQAGGRSSNEDYHGVRVEHVETADHAVFVFAATPRPELHIRSNSAAALHRVLDTLNSAPGAPALGGLDEFKYIRTLMPLDAPEEEVFIYLSDPFIRRMLGPQVKLAHRRRLIGLSNLRMLNYAALLFETQYGRPAKSIVELIDGGCAPEGFRNGEISNPFGGQYALDAEGLTARCSVLGTVDFPEPCLELPLTSVTNTEADQYRKFVESYERYWRRYFDPIAIRIQATRDQYRAETIILPLIHNSIYQNLLATVGGDPADLDALPVPQSNIGGVTAHLEKEKLLKEYGMVLGVASTMAFDDGLRPPDTAGLLQNGLGDSLTFGVCDGDPLFDLNLSQLGALALQFNGFDSDGISIGLLIASLTSPVYLGMPVRNAEVVDQFLVDLDKHAALAARSDWSRGFIGFQGDYYLLDHDEDGRPPTRVMVIRLGPAAWRFYFARIGDGLYIASRREILDDIARASAAPPAADPRPRAHVRLTYRPEHWNRILPTYQLGWAENARLAVLFNLGSISPFIRTERVLHPEHAGDPAAIVAGAIALAERTHGVRFELPDGGEYALSKDGRQIVHSIYGDTLLPHQQSAPRPDSSLGRAIEEFGGLTGDLTFLEDGLHGVITVARKRTVKAATATP